MASGSVTGAVLMERAGAGVMAAALAQWPDLRASRLRAVVLCGPGNNGGDGFVIARLLHGWGWAVDLFLLGDASRLPPDARAMHDRWRTYGAVHPLDAKALHGHEAELWVDAIFGIGLSRQVPDTVYLTLAGMDEARALRGARVVAVDVPSWLCADSGRGLGRDLNFCADLTVTFHALKPGHLLAEGPRACGRVVVADIGLDAQGDGRLTLTDAGDPANLQKSGLHKYDHGHALIVSGGPGEGGAARLSARGALRIGAGLVTVGCPLPALAENAARLDAVMLRPLDDAAALAHLLEDKRYTALCLGPGMGQGRARALVPVALASGRRVVLDADAVSAWADNPPALFALLHPGCVLTPHGGEFARLFPDLARRLTDAPETGPAFSKVDATREAARRAGCTVVFKGPDTVIADQTGVCVVNSAYGDRAAPWLATAGTGDVLAGFITGLMGRGLPPMQAAQSAVWLHVECARSFGPGLIAEDLPEALPAVFRSLGL